MFPTTNLNLGATTINRVIGGFDGFGSLIIATIVLAGCETSLTDAALTDQSLILIVESRDELISVRSAGGFVDEGPFDAGEVHRHGQP